MRSCRATAIAGILRWQGNASCHGEGRNRDGQGSGTPPLGKLTDGVVLVVQANSARREAAKTATESLAADKVHLLGAVLNRHTFLIAEALYRKS
jgi:hypothetical protein